MSLTNLINLEDLKADVEDNDIANQDDFEDDEATSIVDDDMVDLDLDMDLFDDIQDGDEPEINIIEAVDFDYSDREHEYRVRISQDESKIQGVVICCHCQQPVVFSWYYDGRYNQTVNGKVCVELTDCFDKDSLKDSLDFLAKKLLKMSMNACSNMYYNLDVTFAHGNSSTRCFLFRRNEQQFYYCWNEQMGIGFICVAKNLMPDYEDHLMWIVQAPEYVTEEEINLFLDDCLESKKIKNLTPNIGFMEPIFVAYKFILSEEKLANQVKEIIDKKFKLKALSSSTKMCSFFTGKLPEESWNFFNMGSENMMFEDDTGRKLLYIKETLLEIKDQLMFKYLTKFNLSEDCLDNCGSLGSYFEVVAGSWDLKRLNFLTVDTIKNPWDCLEETFNNGGTCLIVGLSEYSRFAKFDLKIDHLTYNSSVYCEFSELEGIMTFCPFNARFLTVNAYSKLRELNISVNFNSFILLNEINTVSLALNLTESKGSYYLGTKVCNDVTPGNLVLNAQVIERSFEYAVYLKDKIHGVIFNSFKNGIISGYMRKVIDKCNFSEQVPFEYKLKGSLLTFKNFSDIRLNLLNTLKSFDRPTFIEEVKKSLISEREAIRSSASYSTNLVETIIKAVQTEGCPIVLNPVNPTLVSDSYHFIKKLSCFNSYEEQFPGKVIPIEDKNVLISFDQYAIKEKLLSVMESNNNKVDVNKNLFFLGIIKKFNKLLFDCISVGFLLTPNLEKLETIDDLLIDSLGILDLSLANELCDYVQTPRISFLFLRGKVIRLNGSFLVAFNGIQYSTDFSLEDIRKIIELSSKLKVNNEYVKVKSVQENIKDYVTKYKSRHKY